MEKSSIESLLISSCTDMYNYAIEHCLTDFVSEEKSCVWYHSVWQFLRILDCVSAPQWHEPFFKNELKQIITDHKERLNILVSGTADYSILHILVTVLSEEKAQANITILDKCPTPIKICTDYNKYLCQIDPPKSDFMKNNITLIGCQEDLFRYSGEKYDLICTDAFLTRFPTRLAKKVLSIWYELLKNNGHIITTVRIHDQEEEKSLIEEYKDILSYTNKVSLKYDIFVSKYKKEFPIDIERLRFLATRYVLFMNSNNLGNKEDIEELFTSQDFSIITSNIVGVPGEISDTNYLQIVVKR